MTSLSNKKDCKNLISVITVSYNSAKTIEDTIQSVISQNYFNIEYIIIDGNSTDNTLEIIKKYTDRIAYWSSEPDKGIYDAMNKGINRSKGKWLYFLGADDRLEPNILNKVSCYLVADKMMVYGDVFSENALRIPSFLSVRTLMQNTVHHQGAFYNIKLFEKFRYDSKLRIISDYELNLLIYLNKLPVKKIPLVIARCQSGGSSSQLLLSIHETNIIRKKHLKNTYMNYIFSILLDLYYFQKKIRKCFFY